MTAILQNNHFVKFLRVAIKTPVVEPCFSKAFLIKYSVINLLIFCNIMRYKHPWETVSVTL